MGNYRNSFIGAREGRAEAEGEIGYDKAMGRYNRSRALIDARASDPIHTPGSLALSAPSGTDEATWRSLFNRDPAKEAAANSAIATSRVGNVNSLNARSAGAISASPATSRRAFLDARRTNLGAIAPVGRTLTAAQGNALFGAPNQIEDINTTLAAGQNQQVQIPGHGTASSRPATWQEQVAAKYPAIHQAGTPENAAYVAAAKAAYESGELTPDHMNALADEVMARLAAERRAAAPVNPPSTSLLNARS